MRRLIVAAAVIAACSGTWTGLRAAEATDQLLATPSYKARIAETGLLPDRPQVAVVREIAFRKSGPLRIETTAPADRAGDLYLYDGNTVTYWWPHELLGVRVRGIQLPDEGAYRSYIERIVGQARHDYASALVDAPNVAGQPTQHWKLTPADQRPYLLAHEEWRHRKYYLPMKVDYRDAAGAPWYSMEFQEFAAVNPPAKLFEFEFPPSALVLDWDLDDPGITLAQAQRTMNFDVRLPARLPEGHSIRKMVRGKGEFPMLMILMDSGAAWLSLSESRALGRSESALAVGKQVPIGSATGYLNFQGASATLSWRMGSTALTLISNLPFADMIAVAASVQ